MRSHVVGWLERALPGAWAQLVAPSWFTCVGLAGLVTLLWLLVVARRHRVDTGTVASLVLWGYVAAVAAGIAVPFLIDAVAQLATTGRLRIRWAGMTSFWGYLAGGFAVVLVLRSQRRAHQPDMATAPSASAAPPPAFSLASLADLLAAPLGAALLLSRLGCFLAGCDYGKVTSLPWAMRFPSGSPAWHDHVARGLVPADRATSLPVHPTQLYEAMLGVAITIVALLAARSAWAHRRGRVFLLCAVIYAVGRIVIEALRGDAGRGIYFGISSGQLFSLAVLLAIVIAALARRGRIATVVAALLAAALFAPRSAAAQSPTDPYPGAPQPVAPSPYPGPPSTERPYVIYPPPPRAPSPPAPAPTSAATTSSSSSLHIGALLGIAAPLNRRPEQVATLAGPSLSIGVEIRQLGMWLDLDSFGNRDASHGTILLSAGVMFALSEQLQIGGRIGLGATLVNFDRDAFRDVAGTTLRFEPLLAYELNHSWAMWLRPLSLDTLAAADLGGPITTWQARIGLAYQFSSGARASSSRGP